MDAKETKEFSRIKPVSQSVSAFKMSKLSFRARALDANRPLPVYHAEDLPDLSEYNMINRAVPEMPTGMEKEEETEHHLQRAMAAQQLYGEAQQLVIPTPDFQASIDHYKNIYNEQQAQPRQFIHVNALDVDTEAPDYDLDSEDEEWVNSQSEKQQLTCLKFEEMIDRLEKGSGSQAQHLTLVEAQALLQGNDEDLIVAVFDYWQAKRQRYSHPLLPTVKTEKRDASSANDHYVAFRRRTERMQTRKNRKNDEASYERMCKLRRDLDRCCQLIAMVKEREEKKRELLQLVMSEFRRRYDLRDWTGEILAAVLTQQLRLQDYPPHPAQPHPMQLAAVRHRFSQELYNHQQLYQMGVMPQQSYGHPAAPPVSASVLPHNMPANMTLGEVTPTADINMAMQWPRQHAAPGDGRSGRHGDHRSKRKHRGGRRKHHHDHHQRHYPIVGDYNNLVASSQPMGEEAGSDDEALGGALAADETEEDMDGPFAFRRRKFVKYHAAREEILGLPWTQGYADIPSSKRYRLYLTSLSRSGEFIGLARRRLGRGGRIWIDRVRWPFGGGKLLEEDICNGVADWDSIRPDDIDILHYRLTKPPDAKRLKRADAERSWDGFPFLATDDSWLEKSLPVSDSRDFFHSSTRVRLKPITSLSGVIHKSLDSNMGTGVAVADSPTDGIVPVSDQTDNREENSSARSVTDISMKTSGAPCSAAALIASVQGAAQKHSPRDSCSKNENTSEDVVFEVPSTKPDASVLQLNFPLPSDAADLNGSAAIVNFNSSDTASSQPSKGAGLRPVGLSFLARQPSWSLSAQPAENGIPSPALVSPAAVAQLLNDSSPTTHKNPALTSVLQVT